MIELKYKKVIVELNTNNKFPKIVKVLAEYENQVNVLKVWERKLKGRAMLAETCCDFKKDEAIKNYESFTFYPNNFCKLRNIDPLIYLKSYHQYLFQQ